MTPGHPAAGRHLSKPRGQHPAQQGSSFLPGWDVRPSCGDSSAGPMDNSSRPSSWVALDEPAQIRLAGHSAGPRPHVRGQRPCGDRPAAGALFRLRHVRSDLRRRRRLDVSDLMPPLRCHRRPGQAPPHLQHAVGGQENLSPGSSTRLIVVPGWPGCCPGRRLPRSRKDRSAPFFLIRAIRRRGPVTTRTNPGAPDAQDLPPGRQPLVLRGQLLRRRGQLADQPARLSKLGRQLSRRQG